MAKRHLPRLLAAAATVAALVAALTAVAGTGLAQSTAAQANYAPTNTSAPTISGSPVVGQALKASPGSWQSQGSLTYTYQWERCDAQGNNCSAIGGATDQTYTVQAADVGDTLRVVVTAHDSSGTGSGTSAQTAVVTQPGPQGAIKLSNGETSIPASSVSLPERLIIDGVKFSPRFLHSRSTFVARFHISDTRGYVVRNALVYALGLPYAWTSNGSEVQTDQNGWASITITPTRSMPLKRGGALVVFVRARVAGQSLLAGTSTRRLVQVGIR